MFTWFTKSGLETTEPQLGRLNLANASSRSIKNFFSVSNNIGDGSEAVQKKRKEDLDGELENILGVAEPRKWTKPKTRTYGKKIRLDFGGTISAIHFNVMHDSAMKKNTYYFWLYYCLLYCCRFTLLCIKRNAPWQLLINCHFHLLNFPTVSSLLHNKKR